MSAPQINTKTYILSSLVVSGVLLAIGAFTGNYIMKNITVVGGVALEGFKTLATLPLTVAIILLNRRYVQNPTAEPLQKLIASCTTFILSLASFFLGYLAAGYICNAIPSLPMYNNPLSYLEVLRFGGINLGLALGVIVATTCCTVSSCISYCSKGSSSTISFST